MWKNSTVLLCQNLKGAQIAEQFLFFVFTSAGQVPAVVLGAALGSSRDPHLQWRLGWLGCQCWSKATGDVGHLSEWDKVGFPLKLTAWSRIAALWNLGPSKLLPCLHSSEISRSFGNERNLEYPSSTFCGINVRAPSTFESWGICENTLLRLPKSEKNALIKQFLLFVCVKQHNKWKRAKEYAGTGLSVNFHI